MNVKRLKRKCAVRGCKNTDTFVIARTRELGGTVIICRDCLKEALDAVKDYKEMPKGTRKEAPPLFFNTNAEVSLEFGMQKKTQNAERKRQNETEST